MTTEFKKMDFVYFFSSEQIKNKELLCPNFGIVHSIIEEDFIAGTPEYLRLCKTPLAMSVESSIMIPSSNCELAENALKRMEKITQQDSPWENIIDKMWGNLYYD